MTAAEDLQSTAGACLKTMQFASALQFNLAPCCFAMSGCRHDCKQKQSARSSAASSRWDVGSTPKPQLVNVDEQSQYQSYTETACEAQSGTSSWIVSYCSLNLRSTPPCGMESLLHETLLVQPHMYRAQAAIGSGSDSRSLVFYVQTTCAGSVTDPNALHNVSHPCNRCWFQPSPKHKCQ